MQCNRVKKLQLIDDWGTLLCIIYRVVENVKAIELLKILDGTNFCGQYSASNPGSALLA